MKQILKSINPKQLFQRKTSSKSSSTLSKSSSSPPSFGSSSNYSSSTSDDIVVPTTPNSLLTNDDCHNKKPFVSNTTKEDNIFKFDVNSAFKMIDRDNNGKIDRNELKAIFNKSLTEDELELIIQEVDSDGDGFITLNELQAIGSMFETTACEEEDELRAAFGFFDEDEDGRISVNELFQGLVKVGDHKCTLEDCRRMIEEVDVNKDGFVCFQDFSRMMLDVIPR